MEQIMTLNQVIAAHHKYDELRGRTVTRLRSDMLELCMRINRGERSGLIEELRALALIPRARVVVEDKQVHNCSSQIERRHARVADSNKRIIDLLQNLPRSTSFEISLKTKLSVDRVNTLLRGLLKENQVKRQKLKGTNLFEYWLVEELAA